jgi:hypothetical protein
MLAQSNTESNYYSCFYQCYKDVKATGHCLISSDSVAEATYRGISRIAVDKKCEIGLCKVQVV